MTPSPGTRGARFAAGDQVTINDQRYTVQTPVLQVSRVRTTVSVPDGGTVLLGGLKTSVGAGLDRGVPVFSSIPFISRLFRNQATVKEDRSLLILVTPRIVADDGG